MCDRQFLIFQFLSTPSGWRATAQQIRDMYDRGIFLSTPSGWRATLYNTRVPPKRPISIHALRVEGDGNGRVNTAEGEVFLSTPSGWRATYLREPMAPRICDFYPRPPGGGRPAASRSYRSARANFYPRPPGGGRQACAIFLQIDSEFLSTPSGWRATIAWSLSTMLLVFLSTPSGWRATCAGELATGGGSISIHALRVEGDA